ncbi:hypothetical protein HDU98_007574 [Podochytrium sp. JEL0797]|nr:hypothetical protein HDU98_007574 [Podochytrium sp. JEL0797]
MDASSVPEQITALFKTLTSPDSAASAKAINTFYSADAKYTNPYLLLNGREDIIKSYSTLVQSNMDLDGQIESVVFDAPSQAATVTLVQISQPKALGGLVPIRINQTIQLQLEATDPAKPNQLYIVSHTEKHVAAEYLSHLPLVGGFYETQLRSAVGQLTLAGGEVLEKYKVLDAVPVAVDKAKSAVESATKMASATYDSASQTATEAANTARQYATNATTSASQMATETAAKATQLASSTANYTGLSTLLSSTFHWIDIAKSTAYTLSSTAVSTAATITSTAKDVAASLIEEGKGVSVSCYSPTCKAGQVCYSPTCARGRTLSVRLTVSLFFCFLLNDLRF